MFRVATCLAVLLLASAAVRAAEPDDAVGAADTPRKTTHATFLQPASWAVRGDDTGWVLTAPEGDFDMAVVDEPGAADANTAVAAAWARQFPGFGRKLQNAAPGAAKDGWDETRSFSYETAPSEQQVVQALASRHGTDWTVLLLKGNIATFQKRGGAAFVTLGSLRPAGYKPESFAGKTPHPLDAARLDALKQFVITSMEALKIPGASIAIIDHGKLVFSGGFGVRELGKPEKVDAETLFMIASNTKGMTTLMLAKEVDEGRFAWTDKVTSVYPPFRLGSAETTAKVEMRHLICACTGMPRADLPGAFRNRMDTPATDLFDRLAATEPTSKFGESFQYSNPMAAAAGFIGGYVAYPKLEMGAAYDKAMQEKVFNPLGMSRTTFDWSRALKADHASPHGPDLTGKLMIADLTVNIGGHAERPAGAAWSSANDMIRYVDNELRLGTLPNGKPYVSAKNLMARRQANVQIGADSFYGMGLTGSNIAGITAFHHGGSLPGYFSDIYFIPDAGVGAVLLTNSEGGAALLDPFMHRLLEILYDGKPQAEAAVAAAAAHSPMEAFFKALTWPVDPKIAAKVVGRFAGPEIGTLTFTYSAGTLTLSNGLWASPMASRANADGTESIVTAGPGITGIEFVLTSDHGKRGLTVRDAQHEYHLAAVD